MDILPGKPVYLYIANLTSNLASLPSLMIVASASSALSCIIHARNEEHCTTEYRGQAAKQCRSSNLVHSVHYKPLERLNEEVDRQITVRESNGNENSQLQNECSMPN